MESEWSALLDQWRDEGFFGLTVPYIFGGLMNHPDNPLGDVTDQREALKSMIREFAEIGADGRILRLSYCDKVHDLTFAPMLQKPAQCVNIQLDTGEASFLWVQHDLLDDEKPSIEDLAEKLWNNYGIVISEEHFSRQSDSYSSFTKADREFLDRAYAR